MAIPTSTRDRKYALPVPLIAFVEVLEENGALRLVGYSMGSRFHAAREVNSRMAVRKTAMLTGFTK